MSLKRKFFRRMRSLKQSEYVRLWATGDDSYKTEFQAKATWHLTRTVHTKLDWHRGIWFSYSTPKYSFTA